MSKTIAKILQINLPHIPPSSIEAAKKTREVLLIREEKENKEKEDARTKAIRSYRKTKPRKRK